MTARFWRFGTATLIAYAVLLLSQGSARGGVIVTWGDTIRHVGDVTAQDMQKLGVRKIGHKSSYFGVFWIDLWTWGGEFCVYEGDRYNPISRAEAARLIGKPESELSAPFLYSFPLGWLILAPILVVVVIASLLEKKKPQNAAAQLCLDERYLRALEIVKEQYGKPPAVPLPSPGQESGAEENAGDKEKFHLAFEAGVEHLVSVGIAREEAERNLALLVHSLPLTPQS